MARTTATEAPWLIPRMPGSAIGLRVMPCMHRARHGERGADHQADQGARQPQEPHDLGGVAAAAVQQRVQHLRGRYWRLPTASEKSTASSSASTATAMQAESPASAARAS